MRILLVWAIAAFAAVSAQQVSNGRCGALNKGFVRARLTATVVHSELHFLSYRSQHSKLTKPIGMVGAVARQVSYTDALCTQIQEPR